jgi:hypothetical protein
MNTFPDHGSGHPGLFLRRIFSALLSVLLLGGAVAPSHAASYTWKSVTKGGGGYVTGTVVHPQNSDLVYARTDVGGAYRWDPAGQRWIPLLDEFSESPCYRVDSMNVDPSDGGGNKVYVAAGRNTPGKVLRSSSRGDQGTWVDTGLPSSVELSGNGDYRWAGERLVIDPNKPGRAFLGSREDGLWLNTDIDASTVSSPAWSQISTSLVPVGSGTGSERDGSNKIGVTFVAFHKNGGVNGSGHTNIIYAGVFGDGIYRSTNAGSTWSQVSGGPSQPLQGKVDPSGNLYVTHTSGVRKWNGSSWSNITPAGLSTQFAGLDIHPDDSDKIIVAQRIGASGNDIFLSTNGGSSWSANKAGNATYTVSWWPTSWHASAISAVRFAPSGSNPNRVWFSDWYGLWTTNDVTTSSPAWNQYEKGHEELVMHAIRAVSPNGSNPAIIYSGAADIGGLRHSDLDVSPGAGDKLSGNQDMNSIDVYEGDNEIVYRVGNTRSSTTNGNGWKSTDGGDNWTLFNKSSLPGTARGGRIAVSAANSDLIVWLPMGNRPYYSTNGGSSWTVCSGITATNFILNHFEPNQQLASNKTGTNRFYVYKPDIGFYRSNTGSSAGSSFTAVTGNGLPSYGSWTADKRYGVKTVPNQDGGVWVNIDNDTGAGVYQSTDSGGSFTKLSNVKSAKFLAFGKAAAGSGQPAAAYIFGQLNADTTDWVYRSDDMGGSWTRLNDDTQRFGSGLKGLEADRKTYGRVYVGTEGRGLFYGEEAEPVVVVFLPLKDAMVKEAASGTNFGASTQMQVSNQSGFRKWAYLQFTVSGIPSGATILSAELALRPQSTYTNRAINAHSVTSTTWGEGTINWTNKPALGATLDTVSNHSVGVDSIWDVTAHITGNGDFTIGLDSGYSGDVNFNSSEGSPSPGLGIVYQP